MDNLTELTPVCHTWEGTETHPRTIPCLCRNWGHKTLSCFLTGTQNSPHTTPFLDSVPTTPSSVECPHTHTRGMPTHTHTHVDWHTHTKCPPHIHMWNAPHTYTCGMHPWNAPHIHTLLPTNFMFFSVLDFFSFLICFLLACLSKHWVSLACSIRLWAWGHTLVCGQPTKGHP